MLRQWTTAWLALAGGLLALSGCATDTTAGESTPGRLDVITSIYPLQYVTARIAGDDATVGLLTPAGSEPHDLELSPRGVGAISDADLVVYLPGFQPSVDDAVRAEAKHSLDLADSVHLLQASATGAESAEGSETGSGAGEHEAHEPDHGHSGTDPHFWLDPLRLADAGDAIAAALAERDPQHAATFTANAAAVRKDLTALDGEFSAGLATCANRDLVTSHAAFGYLAQRYHLTQRGIAGLDAEAEPDARTLAEVSDFVKQNKIGTIYYETLVSPDVARTVASSTGARTAVLDPLEGLAKDSTGDYLSVMRANLATLRTGQECS